MKIFTERGFQEELNRREEARIESEFVNRRFREIEERLERLYKIIEDLRLSTTQRKGEG